MDVTIIQPDFDIHDIMTIEPGLVDIRMAHGYMRADDTLQAKRRLGSEYRRLTDGLSEQRHSSLIVRTRHAIWKLEHAANGARLEYDSNGRPVSLPPAIALV